MVKFILNNNKSKAKIGLPKKHTYRNNLFVAHLEHLEEHTPFWNGFYTGEILIVFAQVYIKEQCKLHK